jgi:hypothetical protein
MAWSASEAVTYYALKLEGELLATELDRKAWDEARKGMEYVEKALPESGADPSLTPLILGGIIIQLLRVLGVLAIIITLVIVIIRLIKRYRGTTAAQVKKISEPEEEIPSASAPIEVLLRAFDEARQRGDYREATRLLYQIAIKRLDMAGAVIAHPDKTNWEYVSELREPAQSQRFAYLTMLFERIWYGDKSLTANDFITFEPRFLEFIKSYER